ncbi:peptidoglycan-binding protein [Streptomyces sp. NPDC059783]|uniref:peptidoglycan-binding protein n=1 Tax=Streptomyces sp. NPDC059783 TaxID=3346944 RepID=UPI00364787EE
MTETTGTAQGTQPGRALAALLRSWWEASAREGRDKPTQQSLAKRLGIDQTTLSRYLNPRHTSNAPRRIVERLHEVLHAPEDDLARACALADAAAEAAPGRRRTTGAPSPAPEAPAPEAQDPKAPDSEAEETPESQDTPKTPKALDDSRPAAANTAEVPRPRRPLTRLPAVLPGLAVTALFLLVVGGLVWWAVPAPGDDAKATTGTAATTSAADWPVISKGHVLWGARTVQLLLRAHAYDVKVDADYGPATAAAVTRFQTAHGLNPDGRVGPDTWRLLIIRVDSRTTQADAVTAVQYLLHRAGVQTDNTGTYTPSTMRSLKEFQSSHALPATGTADEDTWRALIHAQGAGLHK